MENDKYKLAVEALKEKREELQQEILSLDNSIRTMEGRSLVSAAPVPEINKVNKEKNKKSNDYKEDWSLAKKFLYLLSTYKRFLHFREAAEMINELENKQYDIKELTRRLSSGTQSLKAKDRIVKIKIDSNNKNTFWGAPAWLDENNNIKKEFKYNEEYVYVPGDNEEDLFSF